MARDWKAIPKIDAHTHVVLHQRENTDLVYNPPDALLRTMDEHRVGKAVVLPINYPDYFPLTGEERANWLRANNDRQAGIARGSGGRLVAFADCAIDGTYGHPTRGVAELRRAVEELGLRGLKIHASNLKVCADNPRLLPWVDEAADLEIPIVFHSNPSAHDPDFHGSAPSRIYGAVFGRDVIYVIAHMGGVSFLESLAGGGYVDLSSTLPMLGRVFGAQRTAEFLRAVGVERLLFATDFPIHPYEAYYQVLDAMDLCDDEVTKIARANAERMLAGRPPLESS